MLIISGITGYMFILHANLLSASKSCEHIISWFALHKHTTHHSNMRWGLCFLRSSSKPRPTRTGHAYYVLNPLEAPPPLSWHQQWQITASQTEGKLSELFWFLFPSFSPSSWHVLCEIRRRYDSFPARRFLFLFVLRRHWSRWEKTIDDKRQ